mgnify:CR=1 FL=1
MMRRMLPGFLALALLAGTAGCGGDKPRGDGAMSRPVIDRNFLRDADGRYLSLHGINVAGSTKVPFFVKEEGGSWRPFTKDDLDLRPTAYDVSFVGRPFALDGDWRPGDGTATMGFDNVRREVRKLHNAGFDSFRLMVIWEAVEPRMRGVYDTEYLFYLRRVVEIANEEGVYVLVDFHQDMVSRFLAARYNDAPTFRTQDGTVVTAAPGSLESMVLALFGPYTDQVRGDGMPKWAVQTALPEKDMRPQNLFWGTPRIVSQFSPALLCKAYTVYTFVSGDEPDGMIEFACSTLDPASPNFDPVDGRSSVCSAVLDVSDEDLDPWIKQIARYACNVETPIGQPGTDPVFPPEKSVDMLPFTDWSNGSIVSLDAERTNAAFFGSDAAFPGLYARECHDGRANPHDLYGCPADQVVLPTHTVCRDEDKATWQVEGCTQLQEEYWSVRDYLQEAYANAWVAVIDALKVGERPADGPDTRPVLPNVLGYDVMNEPVGYNIMLAVQALVQMGGVNDGMILDLVKGLIDDVSVAETIAKVVPALGLIPSVPAIPAEPEAPVPPVQPVDPGPSADEEAKERYRVEKALYLAATQQYDADKAEYDAALATYPDRKKAAEDEKERVLKSWGLVWEGPDNAQPSMATRNEDGTLAPSRNSLDLFSLIDLNTSFDWSYLRPFYQRVGTAILKADPKALIFMEGSMGLGSVGYDLGMPTPEGLEGHVVFAPHHYEDIYPFLGFNVEPRYFKVEEIAFRDYTEGMKNAALLATESLGNAPVVFGEFGAYFNFNTIQQSVADDYIITQHIHDNYFEGFESLFASRMLWCYSPDNDMRFGDLWNKEDFSIQGFPVEGPDGTVTRPWRAEKAWARPHARALAGRPISTHFFSPLHYFPPDKDTPDAVGEFEVVYDSRESDRPTEIQVPYDVQYPDGFHVWLSDGVAYYDHARRTLYHLPANDQPGVPHTVRILPPIEGLPAVGWRYFFHGDCVVTGEG